MGLLKHLLLKDLKLDNMATTIKDYMRLAKANTTVAREFELFKSRIFNHTLKWEGVFDIKKGGTLHNVKGDSGGWTIWGIAYNYNKEIFIDLADFKDTTYEEAAAIAYIKYYRAIQAFILPEESRLMYFDTAYNMGNMRAIKIMQECAGVTADGIIGPITREKMAHVCEECLYRKRDTVYNSLVRANRSLGKFLKGWLNRSAAIFKA
jgi:lysozyme family protein